MGLSVIHDRNPIFVRLSDGSIRNAYTIRVSNKHLAPRHYTLSVEGLPARLEAIGTEAGSDNTANFSVGPDQTFEARVLLTASDHVSSATIVTFVLTDAESGEIVRVSDNFRGP
jgi:polyferredoxin